LARSESGIAPACDRGGCGALRSFGVSLLIRLIFHYPIGFASPVQLLYIKHTVGMDGSADPNCSVLTTKFGRRDSRQTGNIARSSNLGRRKLVVKNDVEKRTVNLQGITSVVIN
jgi:hypothetical protein